MVYHWKYLLPANDTHSAIADEVDSSMCDPVVPELVGGPVSISLRCH